MFIYNDVLILPFLRSKGWINDSIEEEPFVDKNKTEIGDNSGYDNEGRVNEDNEEENYVNEK